jgi:hypothetical protein
MDYYSDRKEVLGQAQYQQDDVIGECENQYIFPEPTDVIVAVMSYKGELNRYEIQGQ